MGVTVIVLAILFMFAILFIFTGLSINPVVKDFKTSFTFMEIFHFGIEVNKGKTTKRNIHGGFSNPR